VGYSVRGRKEGEREGGGGRREDKKEIRVKNPYMKLNSYKKLI
jgi:hypothetical protein